MKIAYCIPSCHRSGGMERVLALKANYLADCMGCEVTIITTEEDAPHHYPFSSLIRFKNLHVGYSGEPAGSLHSKLLSRIRMSAMHRRKLAAYLHEEKFDVCISMFCHEMLFLWRLKDGSRKVLELHFSRDFRLLDLRSNHAGILRRLMAHVQNWRERRVVRHYDAFVVLSERDGRDWLRDAKSVQVIPNPLSFEPNALSSCHSYEAIAVGRLCAQKGFDLLIEAWSRLPECLKNEWLLSIYGAGPDECTLRERIARHHLEERVRLCSPVADIQGRLQQSSLFCFSSRYEGFGMALVEAMACGLPPVSFSCPCGPDEIIEQDKNGWLIEPFDVDAFSAALRILMEDEELRRCMGQQAAQTVRVRYAIDSIMQMWVALFNNLVNTAK